MSDEIGKGTTTLDYLKVRYGWLGELIDEADTEIKRLRSALAQSIESVKANLAEVERLRAENAALRARRPDDIASGKRLFCDKCNAAWVADGKSCCCCKEPFGAGT